MFLNNTNTSNLILIGQCEEEAGMEQTLFLALERITFIDIARFLVVAR
jgi:hypothetical protein